MIDDRQPADAWTPEGVIRIIRELADHDVRAFSLRVASAGIEVAIDRGGGLPVLAPEPDAAATAAGGSLEDNPDSDQPIVIPASLLGTFWRRPAPEAPRLVEEGAAVEAGQAIGLIEVMKSFHEVAAPRAGVLRRYLVDEGDTVEYGQPLAELDPAGEG